MKQRIDISSDSTIAELIEQMQAQKWAVFISGGAPRDWVLGNYAHDLDLSVNVSFATLHNFCLSFFKKELLLTDPDFGLVTVLGSEYKLDINTLRDEHFALPTPPEHHSSCDNHEEEADFRATDIERLRADTLSRDFSVNALYYCCQSGLIFDPCQLGISDLNNHKLSLVMCRKRLAVDNVICIRILQFMARGFEPNEEVHSILVERLETAVTQREEFEAWLKIYISTSKEYYERFKSLAYQYASNARVKTLLQLYFTKMEAL